MHKVPASGKAADNTHAYAATASLKKGRVYHVQIDVVKGLAGSSKVSGALAYDFKNDRAAGDIVEIPKQNSRQVITVKPTADSTLVLPVSYYKDLKWEIANKKSVYGSKSSLTVKGLYHKEKYYVQVRIVKMVDGQAAYLSWSGKKNAKTK